jgi:hypothetical protein
VVVSPRATEADGGVVVTPGLNVWPGPLRLVGPRSFGLILASVSWAARVAI